MQLVIQGETALFKRLNSLNKVMSKTFWIGVQEEFETNLLKNIKPHTQSGKLERNAYVDIITNGVEGGVRDEGMMVDFQGGRINYGMFVEHGTRPHIIEAKNKKALRWVGGGSAFTFAKSVQHPGTKASHFLERAAKTTFNNLERIFDAELKSKGII